MFNHIEKARLMVADLVHWLKSLMHHILIISSVTIHLGFFVSNLIVRMHFLDDPMGLMRLKWCIQGILILYKNLT